MDVDDCFYGEFPMLFEDMYVWMECMYVCMLES